MNHPELGSRWLLLFHQIPPNPAYVRVKVGRRMQRIGAVALKNTVYVLPLGDAALEDFQWIVREVVAAGGDATVCEARFVEGMTDAEVERRFVEARDADYRELAGAARDLGSHPDSTGVTESEIRRLEARLEEIVAIDFFGASGRLAVQGLLDDLRRRIQGPADNEPAAVEERISGRTWVTRKGVHVDRIASAWLIRRFIDPDCRFEFVPARGYRPEAGKLRFDMFDAEFTHEGQDCTFEVLCRRFAPHRAGLREIAEIVHDIDLKDGKFGRAETAGVAALILGICRISAGDEERLERGFALFDGLLATFAKKQQNS
jgi:hypothetical protein